MAAAVMASASDGGTATTNGGGGGLQWAEVLCCAFCNAIFDFDPHTPVNLPCGHAACRQCVIELRSEQCPLDQTPFSISADKLPVNRCLLKILNYDKRLQQSKSGQKLSENERKTVLEILNGNESDYEHFVSCIKSLQSLTVHLHRAESEAGGSVWSADLSRSMQRKLVALICFQLLEPEGRYKACKVVRAMGERAIGELLVFHQSNTRLSTSLWSAVRARGCQFLGPAMQEETLRLILLALSEGALIARKTLVMYIVQMLADDYPQASKTCVGHVVQLLYRASCFHVIKRDGESSLMQLKADFRSYDALRREHDAQIVQIAMEAGLRISPDQWSSLLYGDQSHRSHMQSIIDKLQSIFGFSQNIQELHLILQRNGYGGYYNSLKQLIGDFELLNSLFCSNQSTLAANGCEEASDAAESEETEGKPVLDSEEALPLPDETGTVVQTSSLLSATDKVVDLATLAAALNALRRIVDGQIGFAQKRSQSIAQQPRKHSRQQQYLPVNPQQLLRQPYLSDRQLSDGGTPLQTPSPNCSSTFYATPSPMGGSPASARAPPGVTMSGGQFYAMNHQHPVQYVNDPSVSYMRFKTRMCREVAIGRVCPRGNRCTYAHSHEEMLISRKREAEMFDNSCYNPPDYVVYPYSPIIGATVDCCSQPPTMGSYYPQATSPPPQHPHVLVGYTNHPPMLSPQPGNYAPVYSPTTVLLTTAAPPPTLTPTPQTVIYQTHTQHSSCQCPMTAVPLPPPTSMPLYQQNGGRDASQHSPPCFYYYYTASTGQPPPATAEQTSPSFVSFSLHPFPPLTGCL